MTSFPRKLILAALAIGATVGAAYLLPLDGVAHGGNFRLLGRLHPLLVHFPIALLLLVPVLEWGGHTRPAMREIAGFVLGLALIGAIAAVLAGLALAHADGQEGALVAIHLRGGIILAAVTAVAWLFRGTSRVVYGLLLLAALMTLAWTAHNGGSISHGADYLTEPLPPTLKQVLHIRETPKPETYAPETVFGGAVHPVLEKYCFSCHGPEKQKGDYRMDAFAALFAGGKSGKPAITAKDTTASELIRRLLLDPDDEKAMPPRQKPHPKAAEIALIRWWIKQGASRDLLLSAVHDAPPEVALLLAAAGNPSAGSGEAAYVPLVGDYAALQGQIRQLETRLAIKLVPVSHHAGDGLILRTRVAGIHFDDAALAQLAPVAPFIVEAELSGSGISDAGLTALKPFNHLERLHLERTALTGKTLDELQALPKLSYLNLCVTAVGDDSLPTLGKLSGLKHLYLFGSHVTAAGLDQLRVKLTECEIGSVALATEPPAP